MPLVTRAVFGFVYRADGTAIINTPVSIRSFAGVYQPDGSVAPATLLTPITNSAGRYDVVLVVNARYLIGIPGDVFEIIVPSGVGSVSVESLRATTGVVMSNTFQMLLDAALLTKENALGNPDAVGKFLTSTVGGLRSWVLPPSGGAAGTAGGVLSGNYPNPGFAADMATQVELDAAYAALIVADTALQNNINTRALITSLAAYAQLAQPQTFTKAQTVKGDAATQAAEIFTVVDSAGVVILRVTKTVGYAEGRLLVDAGNVTNTPGLRIINMPEGMAERRDFASAGTLELLRDGSGILHQATNHVMRYRVDNSGYSFAGLPSHKFEDSSRTNIDTIEVFPGDATNTALAIRRATSTSNAIAGRFNVVFSDATHATRTAVASIKLVKNGAAVLVEPLGLDTQDSASQTGILVLHNGTQKRVKVGAVDSGGVGQRLLTIDN